MFKNPGFAVLTVSIFLVVYCFCLLSDSLYSIAWFLFSIYPVFLAWVIYAILRPGNYQIRELNGEEFGYGDREKSQLGTF